MTAPSLELVCPAGTPAALKAAVVAGADAVYLGFCDKTNARNFPGLNFSRAELAEGLDYAHARGCGIFLAINTFPTAGDPGPWRRAVDDAAALGVDAVIIADIGLAEYTARKHPGLRRHLSVQASASNPDSIRFYQDAFDIKRVVLPRVLTISEIAALNRQVDVETEVFVFGGLCVMAEGRCSLSSYACGESPNTNGVCSPAGHVRYIREGKRLISRLGDFTINVFEDGDPAGYPTLCKGRFRAGGEASYLFEEPASLNAAGILTALRDAGVTGLKIEGRQRGKAYIAEVVKSFRDAVDAMESGETIAPADLSALTEGRGETVGAYRKTWR